MNDVIEWYDALASEDDDPLYDGPFLREYMDKWDGNTFLDCLKIMRNLSFVMEIGVGTGRLAKGLLPHVNEFTGIDISPKMIERVKFNLREYHSNRFVCGDFLEYKFHRSFDIIFSSQTFKHFEDKQKAFDKVYDCLVVGGQFVLSIDKNTSEYIYNGSKRLRVYPDYPDKTREYIQNAGLTLVEEHETEFAYIFNCFKEKK